jgi:hypothetical protein
MRHNVKQGLIVLSTAMTVMAANAQPDPRAMAEASLNKLSAADAMAVDVSIADEAILHDGFKVRAYREGEVLLSRNDGFVFSRSGAIVDQKIAFDGKNVSGVGKNLQVFAAVEMPDDTSVDSAMDALTEKMGSYLPGRDLFYADAAAGMFDGVTSAQYLGLMPINGQSCHYTAFRSEDVDWHLWIGQTDGLPCKYMITSRWISGQPEFEMTFSSWNLAPELNPDSFTLEKPDGYTEATFEAMQPQPE